MKRVNREGPIHLAILAYLNVRCQGAVVQASPNSFGDLHGPQVARQVAKAKHWGMMPGWPDIECVWRGHAIFFEVKAPGGRLSDAQKEVGARLKDMGALWAMVTSIDEVELALIEWGVDRWRGL